MAGGVLGEDWRGPLCSVELHSHTHTVVCSVCHFLSFLFSKFSNGGGAAAAAPV